MMGNNLEAFNHARSISKQLTANKQHLSKTNDRQDEVNLPRKRANSESTGSDYGVTRYSHLADDGSGYLKETSNNGSSGVNGSMKHLETSLSMDKTSSDWKDNSFVYYSKSNKGTQEFRPKNYPLKAMSEKRTTIDQTTRSVDNRKYPVVVDLTLDDSDDDDDGVGGSGVDGSENGGSKSDAVGGTCSSICNSVGDGYKVGVRSEVVNGVSVTGSGDRMVDISGVVNEVVIGVDVGVSSGGGSRVGVSSGSKAVGGTGRVDVSGAGSGVGIVGGGGGGGSRVGVSSGSKAVGGTGRVDVSGAGSGVGIGGGGGSRVGVSKGVGTVRVDVSSAGSGVGIGGGGGGSRVGGSKGVGAGRVDVSGAGSGVGIIGGGSRVGVSKGVGTVRVDVSGACSGAGIIGGGGGRRVGGSKGVGIGDVSSVIVVDGDDTISQDQPSTLPKILAAYSLNSRYPSSELCNVLSQKAKENVVKQNGTVVNGSSAILTKGPNPGMVTQPPLKNGIITQPKNDVISNNNQSTSEPIAYNRNDVMNDVTNLPNGDSKKQMVFSNWSVKHDSNLDPMRRDQGGAASPTETEDQVIITKVVKSADKSCGRKQHPRKTPVEVRKLYFEENTRVKEILSTMSEVDEQKKYRKTKSLGINKSVERPEKRTLEETIASLNGNIHGTPWSFTMNPDNSNRQEKIQTLKEQLAKQQEAVEKLRTKEKRVSSSQLNGVNRMLVVQIPDLKTELGIQSEKKQSFRVFDQIDSFEHLGPANKRKRKTLPRKVSREAHYDLDNNSGKSYRPQKRTRTRIEKEKIKQRLPRRPRGRSYSPVVRKFGQIVPVVSKDLWHREMEKVEAEMALSNRPMDKTSFLLFLGLKKVEVS